MNKGIKWAILTALISGVSIFYNKQVLVKGIDPLIFNIVKNGGTAVILSLALFTGRRGRITEDFKKNWKGLLIIAVAGGSLPFILYFAGLVSASAINANLIHKSLFIWVAFLAIPFLKEKLGMLQVAGFVLIALSNIFLGFNGFAFNSGEALILLATLLWSCEYIVAKKVLRKSGSLTVSWSRMFLGSLILIGIAAWQSKLRLLFLLDWTTLLPVIPSIVLLTLYVTGLFSALKYAPATQVTAILILATPVTNLLNMFWTRQFISGLQLNNLILSLSGIMLIYVFRPKNRSIVV
ncbi:MAG: hypothetical protein UV73_C0003G0103 [Candidatus Gottesmanbacteria bacterium GW2011_GWA2_43_14]|uniref:EamA domain-containing protein n=1 Tax=Candidatus Gottesmanbacteria bacterium GW2011_GWA2_43_14 TaxID=1618443 RepID=A0A0G1FT26_9BACT|nr:MAG: hypothetical protein UV73_C0003G0103 [Candidatus Gottesmanbacteria bacterium GW2011_GWA2_43_14]